MKQVEVVRSFVTHMMEYDGHYWKVWEAADEGWWFELIEASGVKVDETTHWAVTLDEVKRRVRVETELVQLRALQRSEYEKWAGK